MASEAPKPISSIAEPLDSHVARIESTLKEIFRAGKFALKVSVKKVADAASDHDPEAPEWRVDFSGPDASLVLENHAALLDAFASIACKAARLDESHIRRIAFDCENYRQSRATELTLMAGMAAEQVTASGEPFAMSPMNSAERRVVHMALKDKPQVSSESEGAGPARRIIIRPVKP